MLSKLVERKALVTLILIWAAWAAILFVYQAFIPGRVQPRRPDYALEWTPNETGLHSQDNKPYLLDPFMNAQVSWDSEYYISISTVGYDDPTERTTQTKDGRVLPLNYAFYPFYPIVMRVVIVPLKLFGMTPVATSTLAGVLVSLTGTLGAMIALYYLVRPEMEEASGIRTAFYLIIFPTGFFLAQVYTEGLFVGLAFGCLALLKYQKFVLAALFAALATWTRPFGGLLILPLAWAWIAEVRRSGLAITGVPRRVWLHGLLVLAPLGAYLVWQQLFGSQFGAVEASFFGRGIFLWDRSLHAWQDALKSLQGQNSSQAAVYYGIEFLILILSVVACLGTLRQYPSLAVFGLLVIIIAVTSGVAQSMSRYMLAVPSIYIFLSRLGRRTAFDRAWTMASVLLMGVLALLFTYDMWVA